MATVTREIQYGTIRLETPLNLSSLDSILSDPEFLPTTQYQLVFDGLVYGQGSLLHVLLAHSRISFHDDIATTIALCKKVLDAGVDVNALDSRGAPAYFYVRDEEVFEAIKSHCNTKLQLDVVDTFGQGVFHYLVADRPSALYAEGASGDAAVVAGVDTAAHDFAARSASVVRRRSSVGSLGSVGTSTTGAPVRVPGTTSAAIAPDLRKFARALVRSGLHPFVTDTLNNTPQALVHQQIVGSVRAQTVLDEASSLLLSPRVHADSITLFLHYAIAKLSVSAIKCVLLELSPIFVSLLDRKVVYSMGTTSPQAIPKSLSSQSTPTESKIDASAKLQLDDCLLTKSTLLFISQPGVKLQDVDSTQVEGYSLQGYLSTRSEQDVQCIRELIASTKLLGASTIGELEDALKLGADPNHAGRNGETALMGATRLPEPAKAVKLLLEAHADPSLANSHGITPLMRCWRPDCFRLLLDAKADPNARTRGGVTTSESLVRGDGDAEVVTLQANAKAAVTAYSVNPESEALAQAAARATSQAAAAVAAADVRASQCLKLLLNHGVDLAHQLTRRGQPLLHLATGEHVAKVLIEASADVMQRDASNEICLVPILRNPSASGGLISTIIDALAEVRAKDSNDYLFTRECMTEALSQIGSANPHYAGISTEFKGILAERRAAAQAASTAAPAATTARASSAIETK